MGIVRRQILSRPSRPRRRRRFVFAQEDCVTQDYWSFAHWKRIGSGRVSAGVYRISENTVMKVFHPNEMEKCRREFDMQRRVGASDAAVKVQKIGCVRISIAGRRPACFPMILMDAASCTLHDYIKDGGEVSSDMATDFLRRIGSMFHDSDVCNGDIHIKNVVVCDGRLLLVDFGNAFVARGDFAHDVEALSSGVLFKALAPKVNGKRSRAALADELGMPHI